MSQPEKKTEFTSAPATNLRDFFKTDQATSTNVIKWLFKYQIQGRHADLEKAGADTREITHALEAPVRRQDNLAIYGVLKEHFKEAQGPLKVTKPEEVAKWVIGDAMNELKKGYLPGPVFKDNAKHFLTLPTPAFWHSSPESLRSIGIEVKELDLEFN